MWRMKVLGTGSELFPSPQWLESYDLDYRGGIGAAKLTSDPAKAMPFRDVAHVLETWGQQSRLMPYRTYSDGRPNKPLTAFTIEPERVS